MTALAEEQPEEGGLGAKPQAYVEPSRCRRYPYGVAGCVAAPFAVAVCLTTAASRPATLTEPEVRTIITTNVPPGERCPSTGLDENGVDKRHPSEDFIYSEEFLQLKQRNYYSDDVKFPS